MKQKSLLVNCTLVLYFLLAFFGIMHLAKSFLIPLAIGALFAMLLVPVCRKLEKMKLSRLVASILSVLLLLIMLIGVSTLFTNQLVSLSKDMDNIASQFANMSDSLQELVADVFQLSKEKQMEYVNNQVESLAGSVAAYVGTLLTYLGSFILNLIIVVTYTLLFLLSRARLKKFIIWTVNNYVGQENDDETNRVVGKVTSVANSYIAGVFLVVLILSVCNVFALWAIGVEHAILFAILAGILNIIPYLGSIVGSLIPVVYVLITKDSFNDALFVGLYFLFIQQVEGYFLTPRITGGKIKLSPMFTIMIVLFGGFVWGTAGMILFVPLLGIAKVVFDHVPSLQNYGYLIGKE
ncbi:AI-2E family transporter [Sphingobacterium oryzagri]|uniref:AI-2E family transporter n=1 Tax=Sphingobacterium oryzagri TaxID=3025669 RepID=A0ABY7WDP5_9SPHI|nr:AI-2E family transporter [Sphingobacterium sp. KACC 22765]WDF67313.1 AI-2E family transporter [Sphingobacterium sp. KACC 22765]